MEEGKRQLVVTAAGQAQLPASPLGTWGVLGEEGGVVLRVRAQGRVSSTMREELLLWFGSTSPRPPRSTNVFMAEALETYSRGSGAPGRLRADLQLCIYVQGLVLLTRRQPYLCCPGLNANGALPAPVSGIRRKEEQGGAGSTGQWRANYASPAIHLAQRLLVSPMG